MRGIVIGETPFSMPMSVSGGIPSSCSRTRRRQTQPVQVVEIVEIVAIGAGDDAQDCSVREIHRLVDHAPAILDVGFARGHRVRA